MSALRSHIIALWRRDPALRLLALWDARYRSAFRRHYGVELQSLAASEVGDLVA